MCFRKRNVGIRKAVNHSGGGKFIVKYFNSRFTSITRQHLITFT